jgi:hypothetical protein
MASPQWFAGWRGQCGADIAGAPQPHFLSPTQLFKHGAQCARARRGGGVMQRECTSRSSTAASTAAVPSSVVCQGTGRYTQAMVASCRLCCLGLPGLAVTNFPAADATAGALPARYKKAREAASGRINIDQNRNCVQLVGTVQKLCYITITTILPRFGPLLRNTGISLQAIDACVIWTL